MATVHPQCRSVSVAKQSIRKMQINQVSAAVMAHSFDNLVVERAWLAGMRVFCFVLL